MGMNDHTDFELHERIQNAYDAGLFDGKGKEFGIARYIADGRVPSAKQQYIWNSAILPILAEPQNDEERFQLALDKDREDEARHPQE